MPGLRIHRIVLPSQEDHASVVGPSRFVRVASLLFVLPPLVILILVLRHCIETEQIALAVFSGFFTTVGLGVYIKQIWFRPHPADIPRSHRLDRLKRVAHHPEAIRRLPHRCVELILLNRSDAPMSMGQVLGASPGSIILAKRRGASGPLQVAGSYEATESVELNSVATGPELTRRASVQDGSVAVILNIKGIFFAAFSILVACVLLFWPAKALIGRLASGLPNVGLVSMLMLAVIGIAIVLVLFLLLSWRLRAWPIPRGVVVKYLSRVRRRTIVNVFRAERAALVIQVEDNAAMVFLGATERMFTTLGLSRAAAEALLAAWTSTAEPPSDEEIASFCGVDQVPT